MISINLPEIGEEEIKAVIEVLKTGILTNSLGAGPKVIQFERAFAKYVEAKHAIAVNSGTAALHSAAVGVGVEKGFEVILPSFTFAASAEAVVLAGGKPVFVDIEPETFNISPVEIEKAITEKTKAVMPVDIYGFPANLKSIKEIAVQHQLSVIEDAAQAHGATYKMKPVGKMADVACWSFYASKNMTTGEGGITTTDNDQMAEKMRLFRNHGEKTKYLSLMLGQNYRMTEFQAAIGCVQLQKLPVFLAKRRKNAKRLTEILRKSERLQLPYETENNNHSWYLYTVRLKKATELERNILVEKLRRKSIGATIYYSKPLHLMPYYRDRFGRKTLLETESAVKQVFSLPIHPGVTAEQIEFIGNSLLKLL